MSVLEEKYSPHLGTTYKTAKARKSFFFFLFILLFENRMTEKGIDEEDPNS